MFQSVRILLFGGVTGKALGILRELISAALFGTGFVASAYRLAQSAFFIPVQGFLSDSLTSGFVPAYARDRQSHNERSEALFSGMHVVLLLGSAFIATLVIGFARMWVNLLAPGFDAGTASLAVELVRVMAAAMPLYAITALYAAADLAAGRAAKSAARATVQSAGLIVGTIVAWWLDRPAFIAAGFVAAYLVLAIWGAVTATSNGLRLWPRPGDWPLAWVALSKVWSAYRVLIWVPALMQLHFIVERRIASVANPHAIAALDYARFVSDTAVLLLAMPFGLAGLATMAAASEDDYRAAAWQSIRLLLYAGIPISLALSYHAAWVVRIAFARGAFNAESVLVTSSMLQTLAVGLGAQLLGYAAVRFMSARGKNRRVLAITTAGVVANIALNYFVSTKIGVAGLGLAASANNVIVAALALMSLGLLRELLADLILLGAAAALYVISWQFFPADLERNLWAPPLAFGAYWAIFLALVPRSRQAVSQSWRLVRLAR
jgi:putative peptidoglycan lipid II flippase